MGLAEVGAASDEDFLGGQVGHEGEGQAEIDYVGEGFLELGFEGDLGEVVGG